jgi:hypothetical protein
MKNSPFRFASTKQPSLFLLPACINLPINQKLSALAKAVTERVKKQKRLDLSLQKSPGAYLYGEKKDQYSFAPAGMWSSTIRQWSFSCWDGLP